MKMKILLFMIIDNLYYYDFTCIICTIIVPQASVNVYFKYL